MYLRRSTVIKYCVAALVGAVLYCEWFIYFVQPLYWHNLKCHDGTQCTKIIFIADPQIQGETAVSPPLSYLFNWDSDNYLKSTFSVVMKNFKPDILVYLGDLMDEGSIATMPQFHGYVKRLSNIFDISYPVVQVWLPGDNDIGGENEPIRWDKIKAFDQIFDQPSIIRFKNISFYKVNGITHTFPKMDEEDKNNIRIVVSHYEVTNKYAFGQQVNDEIHPHIYYSAHRHESKYIKQERNFSRRATNSINPDSNILDINLDHKDALYEILVPTCSYRMGTSSIGYGAAILENENLRYTVFWSPTRFPYLLFYLVVLVMFSLYFLVFCVAKLFIKSTNHLVSDKVPLLREI